MNEIKKIIILQLLNNCKMIKAIELRKISFANFRETGRTLLSLFKMLLQWRAFIAIEALHLDFKLMSMSNSSSIGHAK